NPSTWPAIVLKKRTGMTLRMNGRTGMLRVRQMMTRSQPSPACIASARFTKTLRAVHTASTTSRRKTLPRRENPGGSSSGPCFVCTSFTGGSSVELVSPTSPARERIPTSLARRAHGLWVRVRPLEILAGADDHRHDLFIVVTLKQQLRPAVELRSGSLAPEYGTVKLADQVLRVFGTSQDRLGHLQ